MRVSSILDPAEFACDNPYHEQTVAHGQLSMHFWYGSQHDLKQGQIHLCDKCAEKVMYLLKQEFGIKDFLKPIEEI